MPRKDSFIISKIEIFMNEPPSDNLQTYFFYNHILLWKLANLNLKLFLLIFLRSTWNESSYIKNGPFNFRRSFWFHWNIKILQIYLVLTKFISNLILMWTRVNVLSLFTCRKYHIIKYNQTTESTGGSMVNFVFLYDPDLYSLIYGLSTKTFFL